MDNGKLIIAGLLLAFSIFNSQLSIAFAAVAHDSSGSGATDAGGVTTLSYTHTTVAVSTLIVCAASYAPTPLFQSVSSMKYNAVDLTPLATQISSAVDAQVEIWYLLGAAQGGHTAEVIFTGAVDRAAFDCTAFTGALSLGTPTDTNDIVTGLSCTVPGNGLCLDVGYNIAGITGCASRTPTGSATERYDICANGGSGASVELFSSTIAATATMSWDHDSGAWEGMIAVPINATPTASLHVRRPIIIQ